MPHDRVLLNAVASLDLIGNEISVVWRSDKRVYSILARAGAGQTSVAWKVLDATGIPFALKLIDQREFANHSLDAEIALAKRLSRDLFAAPVFFGAPALDNGSPPEFASLYAVIVEWIEGPTLLDFLSDETVVLDPESFLRMTRDLCSALQNMRQAGVSHADLHDRNVIVSTRIDHLTGDTHNGLVVIDTGQLKSIERRQRLLEQWTSELSVLQKAGSAETTVVEQIQQRSQWLAYFRRTDQEWVVCHLAHIYNKARWSSMNANPRAARFFRDVPAVLRTMIDDDRSRRITEPAQMYECLSNVWRQHSTPSAKLMQTPFDLLSAELIRNDRALMELFSEEYPALDTCRSDLPLYLYGPRGCGKSTVLRSLSIGALLASKNAAAALEQVSFFGVYVPVAAELRSRFWLIPPEDFAVLEGHVVRYFSLLLIESLAEALVVAEEFDRQNESSFFGIDEDLAREIVRAVVNRVSPEAHPKQYGGSLRLRALQLTLRLSRFLVWQQILNKESSPTRPDAQLIFDVCTAVRELAPFLSQRRICFLVDDYSNQRIPGPLQKRLNQAITFARQGSAIFKVSSEYEGVELEGIQHGREVVEVNVGHEYVSLAEKTRHRFLQNMLERRFDYLGSPIAIEDVLGKSNLGPTVVLARTIRQHFETDRQFYYHGIDTISDLCSGDFAMGLQLVRRIFLRADVNWRAPTRIPPHDQHSAISEYSSEEYEYLQYHTVDGRTVHEIADRLAWLSRECVLTKESARTGEPIVKNHLDVSEKALRDLAVHTPALHDMVSDLVRRGVLFPLEPSRARQDRDGTRRYMLRRILLARYPTALGRHTPIKCDDVERLKHLLTDPRTFAQDELARTGQTRRRGSENDEAQRRLDFQGEDVDA